MEAPVVRYDKTEYYETPTGNKVSKKASVLGSDRIHVSGKSVIKHGVVLRGDFAKSMHIGKYSCIGENVILRPAWKRFKGGYNFLPLSVGSYTIIGENSIVNAASIGSCVRIEKDCVIGKRCIIKDCALIKAGSVLGPDTVVAPFTIWEGIPAKRVGQLSDNVEAEQKNSAVDLYNKFMPETA